jgi:hypothetical protein
MPRKPGKTASMKQTPIALLALAVATFSTKLK